MQLNMNRSVLGLGILGCTLLASLPNAARANVIINSGGTFAAGINGYGELFDGGSNTGFLRTGDGYDPILPGTPRESWGIAADGNAGFADQFGFGISNLVSNGTSFTANSGMVSSFLNAGSGNLLRIDQNFSFLADNVVQDNITLTNVSGAAIGSVKFSRNDDFDVAPTMMSEFTQTQPVSGPITSATYYGFENPDPTVPYTFNGSGGGTFGPADLGAGFQLNLGSLADGASLNFSTLWGLSMTGQSFTDLQSEVTGLGASYLLTGYSSDPGNTDSVVLGYASTPEPGGVAMLLGMGLTGAGFLLRRRKK